MLHIVPEHHLVEDLSSSLADEPVDSRRQSHETVRDGGVLGGEGVRLVHVGLARVDEGLDMAAVFGRRSECRAGFRPCLAGG